MSWCHLCNRVTEEEFYIDHLYRHHPTTLFVMYAMNISPQRMSYINTFPFYMDEEHDDDGEYESLVALCNEIGDHKIGIEDINTVSTIIEKTNVTAQDTCPICIEPFIEKEDDICSLNICNHMYCRECIAIWCHENKKCPVCKIDVASV